ncbi:ABC transporter permease [Paenibacillus larvae]|uniref:ABC transporter-like protein n=3 Tax=Paenibacillus larvae TaxID=1464 RepID=V9W6I1_9BACL|nr:ABC transporter permease [Paenibacillus larvae]AHD04737.1 ABC transporter-like protein [Paenibacillus larvae subsp. larvae DSM 25430]AQR78217.1 hypothetical protein BXP28_13700 [Paenibacillus larvae subsp. larvae]AVF20584.1 ABC transporter-like protein [Paenibacillus larvae subsp. larvae]AVG11281.1 ABC transporter-like protein [Paenibacillus larvae subsp. larvae DSM 25430]ETK28456.1 hypothetical protein ERIC1_1c19190 [Paenibacillus larvae subsp. larvae DSM 25719]
MNSITIYRYRLKQYRQFKRKVWLLANDWSVSLYILLPIALLLLFNWISWWGSKQIFLEVHQLRVIGGWLFLYCWFGNLFMAVEEADKVFLLGMRTLITSLRTISLYYSLQKYATHTVLLFVYLLPLFIQCLLINITQVFEFLVLVLLWKYYHALMRYILYIKMEHLPAKAAVYVVMFVMDFFLYIWGIKLISMHADIYLFFYLTLLALVVGLQCLYILRLKGTFFKDVDYQLNHKYFSLSLVFLFAPVPHVPLIRSQKTPWIFKRSTRLFSVRNASHVLIECFIKSYCRNFMNLSRYLQIVVYSLIPNAIVPVWIKFLYPLFILFILWEYAKSEWSSYIYSSFFKIHPLPKEQMKKARKLSTLLFILPAGIILYTVSVLSTFLF